MQNETLLIFTSQKSEEVLIQESIKFLIYTRFSSFLCLYSSGSIKGFTNKYTWNYELLH